MFIYEKFSQLLLLAFMVSQPMIPFGMMLIHQYNQISGTDKDINYFYGLAGSQIVLLFFDVTKSRLQLISFIEIIVATIAVSVQWEYITIFLGIIQGLDFALSIMFVREFVGWEENRSYLLNNILYNHMFFGILIYSGIQLKTQLSVDHIYYSIIGVSAFRLIMIRFIPENPIYHYRRFEELRAKKIIERIYKGNLNPIEFHYINNNEMQHEINQSWINLFSQTYIFRFLICLTTSLLQWFCSNVNIIQPDISFIVAQDNQFWNALGIAVSVLISPFIISIIQLRRTLITSSILLMLLNSADAILQYLEITQGLQIIQLISNIVFFSMHYGAINMQITQLLPQKGMATVLNLQWGGLLVICFLK